MIYPELKLLSHVESSVFINQQISHTIGGVAQLAGAVQKILRAEETLQRSVFGNIVKIHSEDIDLVPDVRADQVTGGVVGEVQVVGEEDEVDDQARPASC